MTPDEMAGAILNDQARKAADAVGLICTIAGEPPISMKRELFGEFWFRTGLSFPETRALRTVGIFQFTLYSSTEEAFRRSSRMAEELRDAFNRKTWSSGQECEIVTGTTKAQELNYAKIAHRIIVVDASFNIYNSLA